jgi:hypothetical protein
VRLSAGAVGVLLLPWPVEAAAYRPFDGTDADVAELHELELEREPVAYLGTGGGHYLVSGGVLNYGLLPRVELVLQGFNFAPLDPQSGPDRFTETAAFAKVVLREGCLQGGTGPSFAAEAGPLLPTVNDARGFGAHAAGILSTCLGDALIVHWNLQVELLPGTFDPDVFAGAILEPPPPKYVVRPVAELYVERTFPGPQRYSALAGGIWQVSAKIALDAALRQALVDGRSESEVRAGFTLVIP